LFSAAFARPASRPARDAARALERDSTDAWLDCVPRRSARRPSRSNLRYQGYRRQSEYEIAGRPYTTNAGKDVHVRVRRVDNAEVTMIRTYAAHKRVSPPGCA